MQIEVKVITRTSKCTIIPLDENHLKVKLTCPAVDGKANEQLICLLADYFKVTKNSIRIISGKTSSIKRLKIDKN